MSQTDVDEQIARRNAHGFVSQDSIDASVAEVVGDAPPELDTLEETAEAIETLQETPAGPWVTVIGTPGATPAANTTMQSFMQFTADINGRYAFKVQAAFYAPPNGGRKYGITGPTVTGDNCIIRQIMGDFTATEVVFERNPVASNVVSQSGAYTVFLVTYTGTITINGTGGVFKFQSAQNTSDPEAGFFFGGTLEYCKLN